MIRIASVAKTPIHVISYRYPKTGGGIAIGEFPIYCAAAEGLPEAVGGIVATSDLQGVELAESASGTPRLIGHAVAEELYLLLSESEKTSDPSKTGVILAGDLHVAPDLGKRGGKGDVRDIWHTFRSYFKWVAGVAGNHDRFGTDREDLDEFAACDGICYLDGTVKTVRSMRIGGVGGIIGNPRKPFRREESEYLERVRSVVSAQPDMMILHESPVVSEASYKGTPGLRAFLEKLPPVFVLCGHRHWAYPGIWTLSNGTQILNLEGRAILIDRTGICSE